MKRFEGVQQQVLESKAKNQLVSAGAGSGKTTVMIEKISGLLLNEDVDVGSLLVVTFTVLAAQEMKDRLIEKLKSEFCASQDEQRKQKISLIMDKLETASIDTIDGFNSKTIKKYFYDLQVSPNIQIISDSSQEYFINKAMEKTVSEKKNGGDDINLMLDLFGGNARSLNEFKKLILNCYKKVVSLKDSEDFLFRVENEYLDSVKSENVVNMLICEIVDLARRSVLEVLPAVNGNIKTLLEQFADESEGINENLSLKSNLTNLFNIGTLRYHSSYMTKFPQLFEVKELTTRVFNLIKVLKENKIFCDFDEKNAEIHKYLTIFLKFLRIFMQNYKNIKEKNDLIDFNDLNKLMLKLLENDKIKSELQEQYKYIFVDEYQDVNPLQDELINSIVGENATLFMVGDVKQSIYAFRGSTPEFFIGKNELLKQNNEDVFNMNVNFRSNPKILEFVNEVFSKSMTKLSADIDYEKDCMIEPKRLDIVDDKVKIYLCEELKEEKTEKGVYSVKNADVNHEVIGSECVCVGDIVTKLVGTKFYDANLKIERKLKYSDIAILTRTNSGNDVVELVDYLKRINVPINKTNKILTSENEIVKLLLSIFKCVDFSAEDIDYLATFMALTNLTVEDVVAIRRDKTKFSEDLIFAQDDENIDAQIKFEIKKGFDIVEDIRQASYSATIKELIYYVLYNKKLKYYILRQEKGEEQLSLFLEFVDGISSFESCLGICEFVDMVEHNVENANEQNVAEGEDSVIVQTIHKSKGLEYPVVILFGCNKDFDYLNHHDTINYDFDLGLGFDYFDRETRTKSPSLTKYAINLKNHKKGFKEELRLLYVALTRAKNKLFITGTVEDLDFKKIRKNSYLNVLLAPYFNKLEETNIELANVNIERMENVKVKEFEKNSKNDEKIEKYCDFSYKNQEKFKISFKNTVTGINSEHYQQSGFSIKDVVTGERQYEQEDKIKTGINYHSALEKLDLKSAYEKNTNIEFVDYSKIEKAHQILSQLATNSVKIFNEAEFVMYVPYSEIVNSDITDKVLIQGVIDLIIEKENSIIIVDYKFSKLPARVLKEKYSEQLKLYKLAVEKAFNKPVEQTYIYSIEKAELC